MTTRRLKRWAVSEAFFRHCFMHNGQKYFVISGIPVDAKLFRIALDLPMNIYWFIFEHESFPEVGQFEPIPDGEHITFLTNPKDFPATEPETQEACICLGSRSPHCRAHKESNHG